MRCEVLQVPVVVAVAVVGGGGRRRRAGMIPLRKIGHVRAIQREGCLRPEERNVQLPANSPSATMAAIALDVSRRAAGPGGGSAGRNEGRRRWW